MLVLEISLDEIAEKVPFHLLIIMNFKELE